LIELGETSSTSALEEILRTLGLSAGEAKIYLTLARGGQMPASAIAKNAGLARPDTYEVLRRLEKKGFIRRVIGKPVLFEPVEPLELRQKIFRDEQERLHSIADGMSKILEAWPILRMKPFSESPLPRFTIIQKRDAIESASVRMWASAKRSLDWITTKRGLMNWRDVGDLQVVTDNLVRKGVRIRMLLDERSFARSGAALLPRNVEVRISSGIRARSLIVDDREVLYLLHLKEDEDPKGENEIAMVTDSLEQVDVYKWMFEDKWGHATPAENAFSISATRDVFRKA